MGYLLTMSKTKSATKNDFRHLKAAFVKYDRWDRKQNRLFEQAKNSADVMAAIDFERIGEEEQRLALCQAFFEDTKDVNSLSHCQVCSIQALKRFVSNGYSWKGLST